MKMTFGICTSGNVRHKSRPPHNDLSSYYTTIESIKSLNIPDVEILTADCSSGVWLTDKKNAIARQASHDVIVLLHDYFTFDKRWYQAYKEFGDKWDVCSNPQFLMDGNRHFTDWVMWYNEKPPVQYTSIEYTNWSYTKKQYISGGFFLVKKQFLLDNPLNEELPVGSTEDVEWSLRIRDKAMIACNPAALVIHNKQHRDMGRVGFPFQQTTHFHIDWYKRMLNYD